MEAYSYEKLDFQKEPCPIRVVRLEKEPDSAGCVVHWHEQLEFYYICSGGVLLLCDRQQQWVRQGEAAFVSWCELHRGIEFAPNTQHYVIQIDLSVLSGEPESLGETSYLTWLLRERQHIPSFLADTRENRPILSSLQQIIWEWESQKPGFSTVLRAQALLILTHLFRLASPKPKEPPSLTVSQTSLETVKKILIFLQEHLYEEISLSSLACWCGFSVPHICRIFKQQTGTSIVSYLHRLRCSRAAALISRGESVTQAASAVGFSDYNYFSRTFKAVMGESPSRYRNQTNQTGGR